jgi:hypothetical protein
MMNLDLNFNEDELFWGLLLQSDASSMMLTATDIDCIKDFKVLKSLIETSKDSSDTVSIHLCEDCSIIKKFDQAIDMDKANFAMVCGLQIMPT